MALKRRPAPPSDASVVDLARRLGTLLSELGLSEIEVSRGELRIRLQRGGPPAPAGAGTGPGAVAAGERVAVPLPTDPESSSLVTIEAPMVGTFYRASSPTAEPYVHEGDVVKEGQILCIIEAMKLMNEIEAKAAGRIVKICVENAHPVEFGQSLFLIDPAR
jgi:acetyl-CoA carboxylase biotin carboxyl carrier protein